MNEVKKSKFLEVLPIKVSGKKTLKVCYSYQVSHSIYGKKIKKNRSFLIDISQENLDTIVSEKYIEEKRKLLVCESRPLSKSKKFKFYSFVN